MGELGLRNFSTNFLELREIAQGRSKILPKVSQQFCEIVSLKISPKPQYFFTPL